MGFSGWTGTGLVSATLDGGGAGTVTDGE